jgi:hypothetical protein
MVDIALASLAYGYALFSLLVHRLGWDGKEEGFLNRALFYYVDGWELNHNLV